MSEHICHPASFRLEAKYQGICVECGAGGPFHAHHVVDKQTLRKYGFRGNGLYDTRNAMRLCRNLDGKNCHLQFENCRIKIRTTKLSDDNIEYAFEALGVYAYDYLRREYDDATCPDPRLELKLEELAA